MTKKDRVYQIILAILPLFVFFPMYFQGKLISWLDMMHYFMPFRIMTANAIQHGVMPFWNPYIYCGNPLMANMQTAVFYPLNIFYHVLAPDAALRITTYLIFLVMAIFAYGFFRLYKISEEGSFMAACMLAFGFFTTIKAVELAEINVLGWMPAALYFTKKYAESGKSADKFMIPLFLALSLLGGHPQFFIYIFTIFSIFFIYELVYLNKGHRIDAVKNYLLICFLLGALALIQLLPTANFILQSKRAVGGISFEENIGGFMKFEHLMSFFFPFLTDFFSKHSSFLNWVGLIDIGVLPVALLGLGMLKMKDRKLKILMMSVIAVSLLFVFAGNMPFYKKMYESVGFLSSMRYHSKIIVITYFFICFLAAAGFDSLFYGADGEAKAFSKVALACAGIMLIIYLFADIYRNFILGSYRKIFDPAMSFQATFDAVNIYARFAGKFLIYTVFLCASAAVFYLAGIKGLRNGYVKGAAMAIAVSGLFVIHLPGNGNFTTYKLMSETTKQAEFVMADPGMNGYRVLAPGIANPFEFDIDSNTYEELYYYIRDVFTPNINLWYPFKNAEGFDSLSLLSFARVKSYFGVMDKPWDKPAFSLLSARYISSRSPISGRYLKLASKGSTDLYMNSNALKEAFFLPVSSGVKYVAEKDGYLELFKKGFNPSKTMVLEEADRARAEAVIEGAAGGKTAAARTEVDFSDVDLNTIKIKVTCGEAGFLTVTDNYYPGWKASVDGAPARIFKSYTTFKSVFLKPGSHTVVFYYSPPEFPPAAVVSITALLLLIPVVPMLLVLF